MRYFTGLALTFGYEKERNTTLGTARILSEPVGLAAIIIPWNAAFPILRTKLSAVLAAGCMCVVKPSLESPLDAYLVAQYMSIAREEIFGPVVTAQTFPYR